MNRLLKKRILIISMSLALLLLVNIGISYSYYLGKVVGNETSATISFTSAGIIIEYENNSGNITDSNIIPGWSTTKNFTVKSTMKENTSDNSEVKMGYIVKMYVDSNDFPDNSIVYSVSQTGIVGSGQAMDNISNVGIATGTNMDGIVLGAGYFAVGDNEHSYTLTIKYADTDEVDGNSSFAVHLGAMVSRLAKVTVDLDGGTFTGSTTRYAQLGGVVNLEEPAKDGFTFIGWEITSGEGSVDGNQILANSSKVTVKAKFKANIPDPVSFATDSWETIAYYVQTNKEASASVYKVGDTKEIAIDGFTNGESGSNGLYTVRIANNSNYDCALDSKTACGFVVEFVDIIVNYTFALSSSSSSTNLGGWPASLVYKYLNGDTPDYLTYDGSSPTIYSKLPSDLRNVIIDTIVISGHGAKDSNSLRGDGNWVSTDKLYLLTLGEIYIDCLTGTEPDTASYLNGKSTTRQLDYYIGIRTNFNRYSTPNKPVKMLDGTAKYWWLRSAESGSSIDFFMCQPDGFYQSNYSSMKQGLAPAFRIA